MSVANCNRIESNIAMANYNKRAFYVNGEMLRKIIEIRGLTQADVYKAINIGENTIYRVIKYNRMENYSDFLKMCKYLDIDIRVLLFKEFNIFYKGLKHSYIVTPDNIERFIDHLGYLNDDDKKFDKEYIHDFFKGAFSSEHLSPEFEEFLFERILECRDKFSTWYNRYEDNPMDKLTPTLVNELLDQRDKGIKGGIYHITQVMMAYNSNKIEGSTLTEDQTEEIFQTNSYFPKTDDLVKLDDLVEMKNHFRLFDYMLDVYNEPLTKDMMIEMNVILKRGTTYEDDPKYNVGGFKVRANTVGGFINRFETSEPKDVEKDLDDLLSNYNTKEEITLNDIIDFHVRYERIHPFGDGNGRTGRMIMFKECLKNCIMPFVILDDDRPFYIRGLREFFNERGYLTDTILHEQDIYSEIVRKYLAVENDPIMDDINAMIEGKYNPKKIDDDKGYEK